MSRYIVFVVQLLFFLSLSCTKTISQSCTTTFNVKSMVYPGAGINDFFIPYKNNKIITGGNVNGKLGLLCVSNNLDTLWARQYSPLPSSSYSNMGLKNGAYISSNNEIDVCMGGQYFLIIDSLGNIFSSKKIYLSQQPNVILTLSDWKKSPDGDYIILLSGGGYSGHGFFLIKLSNDFTIIKWTKFIDAYPYNLTFQSISVNNSSIVLAGHTSDPFGALLMFKTSNGQFLNQKFLSLNGQKIYFDQIFQYNKGYLIKTLIYGAGILHKNSISRVDSNFNVINSNKIVSSFTTPYNIDLSVQRNGAYHILHSAGYVDGHAFVDSSDNVIWNKGNQSQMFSNQRANLYLLNSKQYVVGSTTYYLNGSSSSEFRWNFTPKDINGGLPSATSGSVYCFNNNRTLSLVSQQLTAEAPPQFDVLDTVLSVMTHDIVSEPFPINVNSGCIKNIMCDSIKIIGNKTICGNSFFTLTGRRNNGCTLPVKWEVLQAPLSSFTVINDSTAKFQSSVTGTYKIVATITSDCLISDTISIQVVQPTPLSIGMDTTICYNDTIVISPTNTYSSYLWSNGLTTPSIVVKDSGRYWLKAIDFCNNIKVDTIVVSYYPHSTLLNTHSITKCFLDTVALNYNTGFSNINWLPLSSVIVSINTMQIVNTSNQTIIFSSTDIHNCSIHDTVVSIIKPSPTVNLGNDKTICDYDSLILVATSGMQQYLWSTGETSQQIVVKQNDSYIVKITALNGCSALDTIVVSLSTIPKVNLGRDSSICEGTSILLHAPTSNNLTYSWNDGSHNSSLAVSTIGKYYVTIKNEHNCMSSDTFNLIEIFKSPSKFLPKDTSICPGYVIRLTSDRNFLSYLWDDGSTNPYRDVTIPNVYKLIVTDGNKCIGNDTIEISLKQYCPQAIYFPNAFTPNKDGLNDSFKPKYWGDLIKYNFRIFNRWGELIFESNNPDIGWNGSQKNITNDSGVFVWVCNYQFINSQERFEKGTLTLIR